MCIDRQGKRTSRPLVGPSLSECTWILLTFVFEFELCTFRASTRPALVQTLKKTGSRMPLRMKKAVLVHSNYIPRTFNPCGDVTVSYILCLAGSIPKCFSKLLVNLLYTTIWAYAPLP